MFAVGQKVRCIRGVWGASTGTLIQKQLCPNLPVAGSTYTIRSVENFIAVFNDGPAWFVRLIEIHNPINSQGSEPVFYAKNFVPLGEQSKIAFAYDILNNPEKTFRRTKEEATFFKRRKRRERVKNN